MLHTVFCIVLLALTQKYQKVKADFCFLEIYAFSHSRTVQTASLYGRLPAPTAEKARFATETKIGRFGRQIRLGHCSNRTSLETSFCGEITSKIGMPYTVFRLTDHQHYCLRPNFLRGSHINGSTLFF